MDEFVTLDELGEEEEGERQDSKSKATNTSGNALEQCQCMSMTELTVLNNNKRL